MDTTKLLIGIGVGALIWLGLGLLVGGLFHSSYRGDEEMGVADTQGREHGGSDQ